MNWVTITGISSAVIALCALVFSIWQGILTRKHNKLSFRPHLTTWTNRIAEKGFYSIDLINNGLGPAIISSFSLKIDRKLISGEGTEPIEKALKILFSGSAYKSQQSFLAKGYSMAAKERCHLVAVQFLNNLFPSTEIVEHAINRCELEITYKSFYEEEFYFNSEKEKSNQPLHRTPNSGRL